MIGQSLLTSLLAYLLETSFAKAGSSGVGMVCQSPNSRVQARNAMRRLSLHSAAIYAFPAQPCVLHGLYFIYSRLARTDASVTLPSGAQLKVSNWPAELIFNPNQVSAFSFDWLSSRKGFRFRAGVDCYPTLRPGLYPLPSPSPSPSTHRYLLP
jgi:hypothetical protein